jgi:hypothetical protein
VVEFEEEWVWVPGRIDANVKGGAFEWPLGDSAGGDARRLVISRRYRVRSPT